MGTAAAGVGRLQSRGGKQTQRTVNRLRVTLLSAFITFLLFRATIGINRLAHYGSAVTVSGHARIAEDIDRVLREIRSDTDDLDNDDLDAATATTRFHHAGAPWSMNYSLAPRVTRWNARRRRWLHAHPGFPSTDARGDERVLLVTASPPGPCVSPAGDHLLLRSAKNKADYCRLHGLDMVHDMAAAAAHRELTGPGWSKLPLLRRLMLAHPEAEWLWWLDAGAVVTDMGFHLPLSRYVTSNLVVHGHHDRLFRRRAWDAVATGSFLLRNCQWSLELLDAWATMGPRGHVRAAAGKLLTAALTGRPAGDADEQSALAHLLLTEREWWMDRVYVENEYLLRGAWAGIVGTYEGAMAKYHPGYGDARWPFVTHFAGCELCAAEGGTKGYAPDRRCVKGMERAFNFADNQVLRLYGFEHRTLESAEVIRRVANRSADPLQAKEEAISYLRKPKDPPAPKKKTVRKNRKRRVKGGSVLDRILVKLGWRH
jgi:xyloglucan 6-xylosyltransferase